MSKPINLTESGKMIADELPPFPPNENPFRHDSYRMGTIIGKNVTVMFTNHSGEQCTHLVIIDTTTGERVKISFQ